MFSLFVPFSFSKFTSFSLLAAPIQLWYRSLPIPSADFTDTKMFVRSTAIFSAFIFAVFVVGVAVFATHVERCIARLAAKRRHTTAQATHICTAAYGADFYLGGAAQEDPIFPRD